MIRAGDTTLLGVLDVDVGRKALDEHHGLADKLLGRALGATLKLRERLAERGCEALVERSGYKGYHLWVRLDAPVPCFQLRRWLLGVVREAQPLPEGIRVEVFPDRDRVRGDQLGPVVKLPLGVHSKTGKRCAIVDERGEPVGDPIEVLRSVSRVSAAIVGQAPGSVTPANAELDGGRETPDEIGPRARKILDGCKVLGYLADKAEKTHYLDHRERTTLLLILGHLEEEGRSALHAIISKTYNYRRDVTDRHIDRLPEWPISCPKVRERHPEAAAIATCACRFELRGRGYPTPLLLALRPAEVSVFREQWQQRETVSVSSAPESEKSTSGRRKVEDADEDVESVLQKIRELKRHRRGIDASLDRAYGDLGRLFERAGTSTLEVAMGSVKRIPRSDGEGWDFVIEV